MDIVDEPFEAQPIDVLYALLLVLNTLSLDKAVQRILMDHALSIATQARSQASTQK
jgi:hypothetical protein